MSTAKRKAAAKKLAKRRGISESSAYSLIDTQGLDSIIDAIGGLSSYEISNSDTSSTYSSDSGSSSSSYDSGSSSYSDSGSGW